MGGGREYVKIVGRYLPIQCGKIVHSAVNLNTKLIRNRQETVRYIKEHSST